MRHAIRLAVLFFSAFASLATASAESLEPGRVRDCADVCPEMVVVPKGDFTMGSSAAEIAALKQAFGSDRFKDEGP